MQTECEQILAEAHRQNILLRVIGGMAVHLHSPQSSILPGLARAYGDLDFVTISSDSKKLRAFFESIQFKPNARFNALQGSRRMIFYSRDESWCLDIFVNEFRMCHNIKFSQERLEKDLITIPLAELFLTKMQIIEANEKDVKDISALLIEHPVGPTDLEVVNIDRINEVCSQDWGFYTTVRKNIDRIPGFMMHLDITEEQRTLVLSRLDEIARQMDEAPKTVAWKLRASIGERKRWYEEPEDATRKAISLKLE
jgi:hypothetical protein